MCFVRIIYSVSERKRKSMDTSLLSLGTHIFELIGLFIVGSKFEKNGEYGIYVCFLQKKVNSWIEVLLDERTKQLTKKDGNYFIRCRDGC